MKLVMVSVRDSALDAFMRPFFVPTTGAAVRAFSDEVRRKDSEMYRHPADYVLFELGSFDEESGRVENLDSPRQLVRGIDIGESS